MTSGALNALLGNIYLSALTLLKSIDIDTLLNLAVLFPLIRYLIRLCRDRGCE